MSLPNKAEQTQLNNTFTKLVRLRDHLDYLQRQMVINGRSSQYTAPVRRVVKALGQIVDEMQKVIDRNDQR